MSDKRCDICGLDLKRYLVQCKECGKWFCNQLHGDMSDAYKHIIETQHTQFIFPENQIGISIPKCAYCGNSNVKGLQIV